MKTYNKIMTFGFVGFIWLFCLLGLAMKDKDFSELENRSLATFPDFTFERLFNNEFTKDFESYVTDQFPFRDMWVGMKYVSERALLKTENNGIYFGKDGYLMTKFKTPDTDRLDKNFNSISNLISSLEIPVHFSLVPSSAHILKDKLPQNATPYDQSIMLKRAETFPEYFSIEKALSENSDRYIYYKTDHHWTSEGAYIGYKAICEAMGLENISLPQIRKEYKDFYGTLYSTSGSRYIEGDTVTTYEIPNLIVKDESGADKPLYDESYAEKKDKYSVFLGGNMPLLTIQNEDNPEDEKLLLIKDSYSNSLVPFLSHNFSEIHIWDLRFNKSSLKNYVETEGIDKVLVFYSTENFATDTNLFMMGK